MNDGTSAIFLFMYFGVISLAISNNITLSMFLLYSTEQCFLNLILTTFNKMLYKKEKYSKVSGQNFCTCVSEVFSIQNQHITQGCSRNPEKEVLL